MRLKDYQWGLSIHFPHALQQTASSQMYRGTVISTRAKVGRSPPVISLGGGRSLQYSVVLAMGEVSVGLFWWHFTILSEFSGLILRILQPSLPYLFPWEKWGIKSMHKQKFKCINLQFKPLNSRIGKSIDTGSLSGVPGEGRGGGGSDY